MVDTFLKVFPIVVLFYGRVKIRTAAIQGRKENQLGKAGDARLAFARTYYINDMAFFLLNWSKACRRF